MFILIPGSGRVQNQAGRVQIPSVGFIPMAWAGRAVVFRLMTVRHYLDVKRYFVKRFGLVALLRAW